jgi:hypothetical protein
MALSGFGGLKALFGCEDLFHVDALFRGTSRQGAYRVYDAGNKASLLLTLTLK